jgi:2-oxoglutarate dehydrogenase E2 component (dihydrolipoamide succinyltransferase)
LVEVGDFIKRDEPVANIETDKVTIPVNCPENGKLIEVFAKEGDTVEVGSDLFKLDIDAKDENEIPKVSKKVEEEVKPSKIEAITDPLQSESKLKKKEMKKSSSTDKNESGKPEQAIKIEGEAIKKELKNIHEQIQVHIEDMEFEKESIKDPSPKSEQPQIMQKLSHEINSAARNIRKEPMSRMRLRIAERMKDAQNTAASLTTFNEVDMSSLQRIRASLRDEFQEKHGIKLGYMSAFVKACASVLQEIPVINAQVDSKNIILHDYVDISVAVATPKVRNSFD